MYINGKSIYQQLCMPTVSVVIRQLIINFQNLNFDKTFTEDDSFMTSNRSQSETRRRVQCIHSRNKPINFLTRASNMMHYK